jgi:transposase
VASTALVSVFMIQAERAGHCARALLDRTHGVLVADRFKAYLFWPMQRRQVCWAHLIRDFRAWSERQEGSIFQSIGGDLLDHARQMFEWWHRVRDGTMSRTSFRKRMRPLQKDVERLLEAGESSCDAALAGKCADILKHRKALWTFVRIEGVEPTNNQAERDLRHAVILRKTSFGTDSVRGSRFIERMLTVVGSLRKQKRDPMSFLVACCEQRLLGADQQVPSLLPR